MPSCPSTDFGVIRPIGLAGFPHTETQMDQLAHGRSQRGYLTFAPRPQARIQRLDMRVVSGCHDGRHIQHGAQMGWPGFGQLVERAELAKPNVYRARSAVR